MEHISFIWSPPIRTHSLTYKELLQLSLYTAWPYFQNLSWFLHSDETFGTLDSSPSACLELLGCASLLDLPSLLILARFVICNRYVTSILK